MSDDKFLSPTNAYRRNYSSVLWIKYGLLQTSSAFVYVNSLGVILSLSYIVIYYCYTFQRKNLHHQFLVGASLLLPPLIHVKYFAQNHDDAVLYLSYTCAAVNILFYGSPLFAIAEVLTTRSTACMAFPISLGSFLLSLQWYIYGCLLKDLFVQIPNGLGFLLGIVQLVLFWKFPQRKASRSAYR